MDTSLVFVVLLVSCSGLPVKRGYWMRGDTNRPAPVYMHNLTGPPNPDLDGHVSPAKQERFIVVYKTEASQASRRSLVRRLRPQTWTPIYLGGGTEWHVVTKPVLSNEVLMDRDIDFIEQDVVLQGDACITQDLLGSNWGLDRIDNLVRNYTNQFRYTDGEGLADNPVNVYLLDSGAHARHPELRDRTINLRSFVSRDIYDRSDHGTAIGGLIVSEKYGVAKNATLYNVRVLQHYIDDLNRPRVSGSLIVILRGVEAVLQHFIRTGRRAVVNMSFGGENIPSIDLAARRLTDAGCSVVASAGNSNANAWQVSPAREPSVISVGATNRQDQRASFSNYGSIVDVFAPGDDLRTAGTMLGTFGSSPVFQAYGTSFSAPLVTGVVAEYLRRTFDDPTPAQVRAWVQSRATSGALSNIPFGTGNLLLRSLQC